MPSKRMIIEEHDRFLMFVTETLKRPIALQDMYISQSNTGKFPVYIEVMKPKMSFTLYSEPVDNDMVYHVDLINGRKPKDNDDLFRILFGYIGA